MNLFILFSSYLHNSCDPTYLYIYNRVWWELNLLRTEIRWFEKWHIWNWNLQSKILIFFFFFLYFYSFLGNWKENHVSMQLIALKHSPPFVSLFGSFVFCFSVFMMCLWWNSTEPKCNDSSGPFVTKQQFRFRPLTSNPHSRKLVCLCFLFPICLWFYLFVCFLSPICLCGATIMVESYHNDSSDPFVQQ